MIDYFLIGGYFLVLGSGIIGFLIFLKYMISKDRKKYINVISFNTNSTFEAVTSMFFLLFCGIFATILLGKLVTLILGI